MRTIIGEISPGRYRTIVGVALVALAVIVLTGAAVRLTEAGLGCENWPACTDERFVPEFELHPWIEFGNRLISGLVAASVAAVALAAYRRRPRRNDLIPWAWGLVAGVAAQIVLGGVTVRLDLHPAIVGLHFLLSMVLLWNAMVLWVLAGTDPPLEEAEPAPVSLASRLGPFRVPGSAIANGRLLVALASAALFAGTLVTGTGPNSGDSRAERLGFDLVAITRVHSIVVWCFVAVLVVLAVRLRPSSETAGTGPAFSTARMLLGVSVLQGGIGYWQFAAGVPPELVALHILGAILVWCLTVLLYLRLRRRQPTDFGTDRDQHDKHGPERDVNTDPMFDKLVT
ncbi:MAG: COX15/CtaA family protein [Acidimicrobiales bacterium]